MDMHKNARTTPRSRAEIVRWASRRSTGKAYYGDFSRHLPGQTYELVLEWTFAIAVARWLTVQPDLQYVINPGGRSSVGSAVVVGAQLAVEF